MSHLVASIDAFTHQGFTAPDVPNHYNEDRIMLGTNTFAVIDGATSLVKTDMGGVNPSAYTSKFLAEYLQRHDGGEETAKELLINANNAFREHLEQEWPEVLALGKLGPCAAAAIVRLHSNQTFSYAQVADCAVSTLAQNKIQVLSKPEPEHIRLDVELSQTLASLMATGMDLSKARATEEYMSQNRQNRLQINILHGVFNGETAMEKFICAGQQPSDAIDSIVMFTDGMELAKFDDYEEDTNHHTQSIIASSANGHYSKIKQEFDADAKAEKYPRLKHMDDASAIVIRLKP